MCDTDDDVQTLTPWGSEKTSTDEEAEVAAVSS